LGAIAAQLVHAAGESSPGNLPEGTIAVVLSAKDEQQLLDIEQKLIQKGVAHKAVREPDPPWNGQLMAIGVVPGRRGDLKKHFKGLLLLN
jgi:peptidyl-tRNA hydrolase